MRLIVSMNFSLKNYSFELFNLTGTVGKIELISTFTTAVCESWNGSDKFTWDNAGDLTVKTFHACPLNFEVSCPTFECRMRRSGNSLQRFAPNVPTFRQDVRANLVNLIPDLFWRVSFSNEDFKTAEEGLASLAIIKIRTGVFLDQDAPLSV